MKLLSQVLDSAASYIREIKLPYLRKCFSAASFMLLDGSCEGSEEPVDSLIAGSVKMAPGSVLLGCYVEQGVSLELAPGAVCIGCVFCRGRRQADICHIRIGEGSVLVCCSSAYVNLDLGRDSVYDCVTFDARKGRGLLSGQDTSIEVRVGPGAVMVRSKVMVEVLAGTRPLVVQIGRDARMLVSLKLVATKTLGTASSPLVVRIGDKLSCLNAADSARLYEDIETGRLKCPSEHPDYDGPSLVGSNFTPGQATMPSGYLDMFLEHPGKCLIGNGLRIVGGLSVKVSGDLRIGNDVSLALDSSKRIECDSLNLGNRTMVAFDAQIGYCTVSGDLTTGNDVTLIVFTLPDRRQSSIFVPAGTLTVL